MTKKELSEMVNDTFKETLEKSMDLIKQDCLETLHANSDDNGQVDLFNALVSLMTNYMGYAANFGALAAIKVLDQVGAIDSVISFSKSATVILLGRSCIATTRAAISLGSALILMSTFFTSFPLLEAGFFMRRVLGWYLWALPPALRQPYQLPRPHTFAGL